MLATKPKKIQIILLGFLAVAGLGLADSLYLAKKHYTQEYTCSLLDINNCESVLSSSYSTIFNIPIAVIGVIYYLLIFISALIYLKTTAEQNSVRGEKNNFSKKILSFLPMLSFLFSMYLIYVQLFVLHSVCQYCMLSAGTSTLIFILSIIFIKNKIEIPINTEEVNK